MPVYQRTPPGPSFFQLSCMRHPETSINYLHDPDWSANATVYLWIGHLEAFPGRWVRHPRGALFAQTVFAQRVLRNLPPVWTWLGFAPFAPYPSIGETYYEGDDFAYLHYSEAGADEVDAMHRAERALFVLSERLRVLQY